MVLEGTPGYSRLLTSLACQPKRTSALATESQSPCFVAGSWEQPTATEADVLNGLYSGE
jgi:hypothetical protein